MEYSYKNFDFSKLDYGQNFIPEEVKAMGGYMTEIANVQECQTAKKFRVLYEVNPEHPVCPYCARPIIIDEKENTIYCHRCRAEIARCYGKTTITLYEAIRDHRLFEYEKELKEK